MDIETRCWCEIENVWRNNKLIREISERLNNDLLINKAQRVTIEDWTVFYLIQSNKWVAVLSSKYEELLKCWIDYKVVEQKLWIIWIMSSKYRYWIFKLQWWDSVEMKTPFMYDEVYMKPIWVIAYNGMYGMVLCPNTFRKKNYETPKRKD